MYKPELKIIIYVEDGLVQEVRSTINNIKVCILDKDVKAADPDRYDEKLEEEYEKMPFIIY